MEYLDLLTANIAKGLPVAIVEMKSDSYDHTQWGKTYVPELHYDKWAAMDDVNLSAAAEPAKAEAIEEKPAAREPVEEKGDGAMESEDGGTPPPTTRRHRPAA